MHYKVGRYSELIATAVEDVEREGAIVRVKLPELRKESAAHDADNWNIFETVSKAYLEAKDRVSVLEIRARARDNAASARRAP